MRSKINKTAGAFMGKKYPVKNKKDATITVSGDDLTMKVLSDALMIAFMTRAISMMKPEHFSEALKKGKLTKRKKVYLARSKVKK